MYRGIGQLSGQRTNPASARLGALWLRLVASLALVLLLLGASQVRTALAQPQPQPQEQAQRTESWQAKEFRKFVSAKIPDSMFQANGDEPPIINKAIFIDIVVGGFENLSAIEQVRFVADAQDLSTPKLVRHVLSSFGPGFVKLGQLLTNIDGLLPEEYYSEIESLSSNAPKLPFSQIQSIIETSFQKDEFLSKYASIGFPTLAEAVFSFIDPKPLAAGSLGQVHRAVLRSGETVIIKIMKAGAPARFLSNLDLLDEVAVKHNALTFRSLVKEMRFLATREVDLNFERGGNITLGPSLSLRGIGIPTVYSDASTESVLVQSVAPGRPADSAEIAPENKRDVAQRIMSEVLLQVMIDGEFHADPHKGNIFIDKDANLTFIDWGMRANITWAERIQLVRVLWNMKFKNAKGLGKLLANSAFSASAIEAVAQRVFDDSDGEMLVDAQKVFLKLQLKGFPITGAWMHASKALMMAHGVAQLIDRDYSPVRAAFLALRSLPKILRKPVTMKANTWDSQKNRDFLVAQYETLAPDYASQIIERLSKTPELVTSLEFKALSDLQAHFSSADRVGSKSSKRFHREYKRLQKVMPKERFDELTAAAALRDAPDDGPMLGITAPQVKKVASVVDQFANAAETRRDAPLGTARAFKVASAALDKYATQYEAQLPAMTARMMGRTFFPMLSLALNDNETVVDQAPAAVFAPPTQPTRKLSSTASKQQVRRILKLGPASSHANRAPYSFVPKRGKGGSGSGAGGRALRK